MSGLTKMILIDSREKEPYKFKEPSRRASLETGDYSLSGSSGAMAIERKSINDLVQSLCHDRERFEAELARSRDMEYFALVIEGSLTDMSKGRYRSQMQPKAVVQSLLAFSIRYRLPIFFCENRKYGQRITESLLLKYAREKEFVRQKSGNSTF